MIVIPQLGEAVVNILADPSELEDGMEDAQAATEDFADNAESNFDRVQDGLDSIAGSAKNLAKIGGVTFGGLTGAIVTALRATTEHENAMARLNARLGETDASELEEYAEYIQSITRFSNEAALEAANVLGRFDMQNEMIKEMLPGLADFAELNGKDLTQAAELAGRALYGQTSRLQRLTGELTETQKEMLDSNDQQERMNALLDIFAKHEGRAAERMANTLSGEWRRMRNEIDDLLKEIGRLFTDDVQDRLGTVRDIVGAITAAMGNLDDEQADVIRRVILFGAALAGLVTAGSLGIVMLATLIKSLSVLVGVLAIVKSPIFLLIAAVGLLATAWAKDWGDIQSRTETAWGKIKPILKKLIGELDKLKEWFFDTKIGQIVKEFWDDISDIWTDEDKTFKEKVNATINSTKSLIGDIANLFIPEETQQAIKDYWNELEKIWSDEESSFWTKVAETVEATIGLVLDVGEPIWEWTKGKIKNIGEFVQAAWDYFIKGEEDAFEDVEFGIGEIIVTIAGFKIAMKAAVLAGILAKGIGALAGFAYKSGVAFNVLAAAGMKIASLALGICSFVIAKGATATALIAALGGTSLFKVGILGLKLINPLLLAIPITIFWDEISEFVSGSLVRTFLAGLLAGKYGAKFVGAVGALGWKFTLPIVLALGVVTFWDEIKETGKDLKKFLTGEYGEEIAKKELEELGIATEKIDDNLVNAFQNLRDMIIALDDIDEEYLRFNIDTQIRERHNLSQEQVTALIGAFTDEEFLQYLDEMPEFEQGGPVIGPGTGTSDSIPAWLSNGEYVINAEATSNWWPLLEAINENKFAEGGAVGAGGNGSGGVNIPGLSAARESLSGATADFDGIIDTVLNMFSRVLQGMLDMAREQFGDTEIFQAIESFVEDVQEELESMGEDDPDPEPDPEDTEEAEEIIPLFERVKNAVKGLPDVWNRLRTGLSQGLSELTAILTSAEERARVFDAGLDLIGRNLLEAAPQIGEILETFAEQAPEDTEADGLLEMAQAGMAAAGPLGVIAELVQMLIGNMQIFQVIMDAVGPIMQDIADILSVALMPILAPLAAALELLAIPIGWLADGVIKFWNGLMDLISKIPFVSMDKYKIAHDEGTDAIEDTTNAMRNVPEGIKIAEMAFRAATPRQVPSAAVGGTVKSSGIAEVHKGEIIANKQQQSEMGGKSIIINFNRPVYGMNDFERQVNKVVDNASKRAGLGRYGLNTAGGK